MTSTVLIPLRKAIILAILFSAILFWAFPIRAEDATSTGSSRKILVQQKVETRIETNKENTQEKIANLKDKMASREAAMKAKLDAFKDKRKAQTAERVNTNLNQINKNQTDQMLKFLDKATEILNKLEIRVNQNTPDIKDPAAAKAAIADARTKIASAEAAVKAQAQNDYTIQVTSETAVKKDAQAVREKLHSDLLGVRKLVIDAKQGVSNAIRIAKSGSSTKPPTSSESAKEATGSGQ